MVWEELSLTRQRKGTGKGLKVLQLCVRFPPAPGGVETHVLQISRILKGRGHDVTVFTSDLYKEVPFTKMDPAEDSYQEVDGIPVHRFKAHSLGDEMHYVLAPSMLKPIMTSGAQVLHALEYCDYE